MADRFYSTDIGGSMDNEVAETAATQAAKHVEVRVTYDAAGATKTAVLLALDAIKAAILKDTYPPV